MEKIKIENVTKVFGKHSKPSAKNGGTERKAKRKF